MTDGLQARMTLAERIVAEAMDAAARAFRTTAGAGRVKTPGDLVTEADLAIEALLNARIRAAFPGDAVAGEAMALADEIVVMRAGRIVERGAPTELYRRPASRFTADFLGLTKVLTLDHARGRARLPWGEVRPLDTPAPFAGPAAVAIRPEDMEISPDPDGWAVVEQAVFLGASIHYSLRCGDLRLRGTSAGGMRAILEPGTAVRVTAPGTLHVLTENEPGPTPAEVADVS